MVFFSAGFDGCFALFDLLPTFSFFYIFWLSLWTVSLEVTMFVTVSAFEWELLVIQFLVVMSGSHRELYGFRKPDF